MKNLLIAEKPSVGQAYKSLLETTENESFSRKEGYLEGKNWYISWCIGHLVVLGYPDEYGWTKWNKESLPMIPQEWKWKVKESTKKQFHILEKLLKKITTVVNGTDAGREGELIYRLLMLKIKGKEKIEEKRLWLNSFVLEDMVKQWQSLEAASTYDNLYASAISRAKSDWLVGMNFSRAYSVALNAKGLSIGRVQTPTLNLIVKRDHLIQNWKEAFYYQLEIVWNDIPLPYVDDKQKDFEDTIILENVKKECLGQQGKLIALKKQRKKEAPPLPFDLASLQKAGNKTLGFKAQKVLDIAQSLYEKKMISYPRTDSCYLPVSMFEKTWLRAKTMSEELEVGHLLLGKGTKPKFFNTEKVTDHFAIIPTTEKRSNSLSDDEKQIYEMIRLRFLLSFLLPYIYDEYKLVVTCGDNHFASVYSIAVDKGFKSLIGEKKEDKRAFINNLFRLEKGCQYQISNAEVLKKERKKPIPYSEGTLIAAMETAGRQLEDKAEREAMKSRGLGTPATRAAIIENLKAKEYITAQGKKILSTAKGKSLIAVVGSKIKNPSMTGEWEHKLTKMENNDYDSTLFLEEITDYVKKGIDDLFSKDLSAVELEPKTPATTCPFCSSKMKLNDYGCFCQKCELKVWRKILGKKLSDKDLELLIVKGTTSLISGFLSKAGKKFDAKLCLNKKTKKVEFSFDKKKGI